MKKILLFVTMCVLCAACSECRLPPDPPFVRDIVMPTEMFDAGDEVTVAAVGFESDDGIFVRRIDPSTQMQTTLWAEITERTYNSVSFIMPAGYAAGAVEVLLFRGGEHMVLGSIEVSDGSLPTEALLYGLGRNDAGEFVIYDIDTATGAVSEKVVCPHALDGAVTWPSTNRIFGTDRIDGKTVIAGYDFTMRRHLTADCDADCIIGMCGKTLLPMGMEDDMRIRLIAADPAVSRSLPPQKRYLTGLNIPDDVVAAEFADSRFVYLEKGAFLTKMSVTTADGKQHVAFAALCISSYVWTLGESADDADDILPVTSLQTQCVIKVKGEQSTVCAVTVSETTLQPTTGAALGHVAGKAISGTYNEATGGIFLLTEVNGTKMLGEFTPADGTYKEICNVPNCIGQILSVK